MKITHKKIKLKTLDHVVYVVFAKSIKKGYKYVEKEFKIWAEVDLSKIDGLTISLSDKSSIVLLKNDDYLYNHSVIVHELSHVWRNILTGISVDVQVNEEIEAYAKQYLYTVIRKYLRKL